MFKKLPVLSQRQRMNCSMIMGFFAGACALSTYTALSWAGFPDGHLTEFERWFIPYQEAATLANALLCGALLGTAFLPIGASKANRILVILSCATLTTSLLLFFVLPVYGQDVLLLENGQGG